MEKQNNGVGDEILNQRYKNLTDEYDLQKRNKSEILKEMYTSSSRWSENRGSGKISITQGMTIQINGEPYVITEIGHTIFTARSLQSPRELYLDKITGVCVFDNNLIAKPI